MVDQRTRLSLWRDGGYLVGDAGADGSITLLTVRPDGTVLGSRTTPAGVRESLVLESTGAWLSFATVDAETKLRDIRGALDGPWRTQTPIRLPDGGEMRRSRDAAGNVWESGHSPAHITPKGWPAGDNTWVTVWHPSERRADGSSTRESFTYGTEKSGGSKTSYSTTRGVERDAQGHEVRRTSVTGAYDHDTGAQDRLVTIRYPDGSWVKQSHRTEKDGTWSDQTTTHDGHGHYVTRNSTGHGDTTDTYEEKPSDTDPTDHGDGSDPEPPDKGSPTGDGDDTGGEGNPDGPLAGVDIRDLLGDDWEGPEDLDTLGDLEGLMRPWLDRIRATLLAGGSGAGDVGELLDDLGAPPVIDVDLSGYVPDPGEELDDLGRPRPIFVGHLGASGLSAAGTLRTSALGASELLAVAGSFASSAVIVARSAAVVNGG